MSLRCSRLSLAEIVSLGQFWSNSRIRVFMEDEDSVRTFGTEHGITIMNHSYETDFVFCWMVVDSIDILPVRIMTDFE